MSAVSEILRDINAALENKKRVVIAIDGPCCGGKTTLAERLSGMVPCTVFHTDDFFLPKILQKSVDIVAPGENLDHERLFNQVLSRVGNDSSLSYQRFCCEKQQLSSPITVSLERVVIVEGVYSAHPKYDSIYDFKYFLDLDTALQRSRLVDRNGDNAEAFYNRWIPLEEAYFQAFRLREKLKII